MACRREHGSCTASCGDNILHKREIRKKEKQPKKPVAKQILYYSTHISKFYALHPLTYLAALGFHGYSGFEASWQIWLLTLLCMVITECMVRGYNAVYDIIKLKIADKKDRLDGTE